MTFGVEAETDDFLERIEIRQDGRDFEALNGEINLTTLNSNVDGPERRAFFKNLSCSPFISHFLFDFGAMCKSMAFFKMLKFALFYIFILFVLLFNLYLQCNKNQ